jgi:hypothetical protein
MKNLNTDDIFLRNLTIAILDLLNGETQIDLARNNVVQSYSVPFFYNYGTDEGFLKDFYVGLPDNCRVPVAEGTYDIVPRGIVTLSSFQVKSSDITNKFVRGNFAEDGVGKNGEPVYLPKSALLYSLPLQVKFDIKVIVDNLNKAFKVAENLLDLNYSNRVVYFQYKGVRIAGQIQFPDAETIEKNYKFTYADNNKLNVNLSVTVETYFPSFEKTSERNRGNVMDKILVTHKDPNGGVIKSDWTDQNT